MEQNVLLFEVSWEVCNKVGGINTVLKSKLKEATEYFKENYIMIGPLLEFNKDFVENKTPLSESIYQVLKENNINCKIGYWDSDEKPLVILVDFKNKYKTDELLYNLWNDFGVDSLASNYEYIEPILFATASGEIIKILAENVFKNNKFIAQFHEWLSGAGLLFIKKYSTQIPTIFTTHATVLGRALAGDKRCVYNLPKNFDPILEAKKYGVFSKHSLESAAAKEADCFTTVSSITADEANSILNRYPDKIVLNGLHIDKLQNEISKQNVEQIRTKLIDIATKTTGEQIPNNAILWITSGRFEFHNKGYDLLLSSLSKLEQTLPEDSPTIVMFFLIAAKQYAKRDMLFASDLGKIIKENNIVGITTHEIINPASDLIIRRCNELNLRKPKGKIRIVYSNAYLDGNDGVFDIKYKYILAACDLSIFPSLYEPFGYTPLESITYGTPTITTNLSGFGNWVLSLKEDNKEAIQVLDAKCGNYEKISDELKEYLSNHTKQDLEQRKKIKGKAGEIAKLADWSIFYPDYIDAYTLSIKLNEIYLAKFDVKFMKDQWVTYIKPIESIKPKFHILQHESQLPEKLKGLRDLAYNFWWTWNENSKSLFKEIDPIIWKKVNQNPVHFLNLVSSDLLSKFENDDKYLEKYNNVLSIFNNYLKDKDYPTFCDKKYFNEKNPLIYFCMEYGIDKCLPIYSGGLGMLSGDYLKTLSDINIPTIAIGLFYKQGFFKQKISANGDQIVAYVTKNPNQIPMKTLNDKTGKTILVNIEILNRTIYCKVWEVKIGRVSLYLLDTDTPENTAKDRKITQRLYSASRENRLIQEIVLGIGGTKFILENLKIEPIIYHLNEGHSAFSLLERIKYHYHQGLSFNEALELVRSSSIFTTHTAVPAGNETFEEKLFKKYFSTYAEIIGTNIEKLFELGKDYENNNPIFSMTALAMRICNIKNSVSKIHNKVSKSMWRKLWKSLLEEEIPIEYVTNGVHINTWLGKNMKSLYNQYLDPSWKTSPNNPLIWEKIKSISNEELWQTHIKQKEKLIHLMKRRIIKEYSIRNESKKLINSSLNCLKKDSLLIGLARRITEYKRNDLILRDPEKLAEIITSSQKPVVIIVAGKSHPQDTSGIKIIKYIIQIMRNKIFNGHIIFLENYDMALAKALTQGVDLWLNTPLLNNEACGTSGMKAGINGVLNFSIKDGWWKEVKSKTGFDIQSFEELSDINRRNDMENMDLLNTLENTIVPLFYKKNNNGFSTSWVNKMKESIMFISPQYNTNIMVKNYFSSIYCSTIEHLEKLTQNDNELLKEIAKWKQDIIDKFNTVKIKDIIIKGLKNGKLTAKGKIKVQVFLFSGKLAAKEVKVELVLIKSDGHKFISKPKIIPLKLTDHRKRGILSYTTEYTIKDTGFYSYAVRVFPFNRSLMNTTKAGVMFWG